MTVATRQPKRPLAELLRLFEGATSEGVQSEDRRDWSVDAAWSSALSTGWRDGLELDLSEALATGSPALDIVNGP